MNKITDEEIKQAAGHPDAIPQVYIDWFIKGAKWLRDKIETDSPLYLTNSNEQVE